jgi:KEOPS complex subunit Cgi121
MSGIEIIGARGVVDDPAALLLRLRSLRGGGALVLDADLVCGREHLESAVEHALRSFQRGTNSANDIMMETMLFASGERQIAKAREKMSLGKGGDRVALVLFGASKEDALEAAGLEEDASVLDCTPEKLSRFGIGAEEMRAVDEGKARDLALERVAFVEILKR